jgi:hypothetical protein
MKPGDLRERDLEAAAARLETERTAGLETARAVVARDGDAVVSSCCVLVSDNPPYLPSPLLSLSMVLGSCGRRGSGDVDGLCGRSDASSTPPSPQTTSFAIFI